MTTLLILVALGVLVSKLRNNPEKVGAFVRFVADKVAKR